MSADAVLKISLDGQEEEEIRLVRFSRYEALQEELNRIAVDPARAFSLVERGFVVPVGEAT